MGLRKYLNQKGNEIYGEKVIKLVFEKNMLLEVIKRCIEMYFYFLCFFIFELNVLLSNEEVEDLCVWSLFVWSRYVFLVILVDFFWKFFECKIVVLC